MSILGAIGDYFLRVAGSNGASVNVKLLCFGILLYALTAVGWFYSINHLKLSTVGVVYSLSTILFLTLLGTFYFQESLTLREGVGLVLAICAILLLGRFA